MDDHLKELEEKLKSVTERLQGDLRALRSNRPSVELLEGLKAVYYEQPMTVKQLGSLSVMPPRSVAIQVWDKNAVGAVVKAIEAAQLGFSVTNDGNTIYAALSPLSDERREELSRMIKKNAEQIRIQVRALRDEAIKKAKTAEDEGKFTEDDTFSLKEKIQTLVDNANKNIESLVEAKIKEIME